MARGSKRARRCTRNRQLAANSPSHAAHGEDPETVESNTVSLFPRYGDSPTETHSSCGQEHDRLCQCSLSYQYRHVYWQVSASFPACVHGGDRQSPRFAVRHRDTLPYFLVTPLLAQIHRTLTTDQDKHNATESVFPIIATSETLRPTTHSRNGTPRVPLCPSPMACSVLPLCCFRQGPDSGRANWRAEPERIDVTCRWCHFCIASLAPGNNSPGGQGEALNRPPADLVFWGMAPAA